jgi:DNA-binding FadR family transcriptional regulator
MFEEAKVVRESRADLTVKAVTELIIARGLRSGDLIPTESELCAELGIGRNSLREAVRTLKATGVLEVRHGSGTYVGTLSLQSLSDELLFHSRLASADNTTYLKQLSVVRESLEQGLITNLITEGLMPNVDKLQVYLEQMDLEARQGFISPETDRKFHEELLAPLNNPLAIQLLQVFWEIFDALIVPESDVAVAIKSADRHHQILLAIKALDARGARVAVRSHFEGLRDRLGMEDFSID